MDPFQLPHPDEVDWEATAKSDTLVYIKKAAVPTLAIPNNANGTMLVPTTTAAPAENKRIPPGPGGVRLTQGLARELRNERGEAMRLGITSSLEDPNAAVILDPSNGSRLYVTLGEKLDLSPASLAIMRAAEESGKKRKRSHSERSEEDLPARKHVRVDEPAPRPINESGPAGDVQGQAEEKKSWASYFQLYVGTPHRSHRLSVQKHVEAIIRRAMEGRDSYPTAEDVRILDMYGAKDSTLMQFLIDAAATIHMDNRLQQEEQAHGREEAERLLSLELPKGLSPEARARLEAGRKLLAARAAGPKKTQIHGPQHWEIPQHEHFWDKVQRQIYAFQEAPKCTFCVNGRECGAKMHKKKDLVTLWNRDPCYYHEHTDEEERAECKESMVQEQNGSNATSQVQRVQPGPAKAVVALDVGSAQPGRGVPVAGASQVPAMPNTARANGEQLPAEKDILTSQAQQALPIPPQPSTTPVVAPATVSAPSSVEEEDLYNSSPPPPQQLRTPATTISPPAQDDFDFSEYFNFDEYNSSDEYVVEPRVHDGDVGLGMLSPAYEGKGKGRAV